MTLKRKLRLAIHRHPFYWRWIRDSPLKLRIRDPGRLARMTEEEVFYKSLFKNAGVSSIFDIGANNGDKSALFIRCGAMRVVLIEPDPHWREILDWRFRRIDGVAIRNVAVSSTSGTKQFFRFAEGSALNTLEPIWVESMESSENRFGQTLRVMDSPEVEVITFEDLVASFGLPDYAKIDVEGHELEVLRGVKTFPRLMSLEFNLPEFGKQLEQACDVFMHTPDRFVGNWIACYRDGFLSSEWVPPDELLKRILKSETDYAEVFFLSVLI